MTQEELAEALGTARRTVQAWENGERPIPLTAHARLGELFSAPDAPPSLADVPDIELVAELMRRLATRPAVTERSLRDNKDTHGVASAQTTSSPGAGVAFSDEIVGSLAPRTDVPSNDRTAPKRRHGAHG